MKNKNINTSVTTKPPVEAASAEHIESADSNFAQTQRRKKKRDLRKKDWAILKRFISYSLQYKKTLILAILSIPLLKKAEPYCSKGIFGFVIQSRHNIIQNQKFTVF